MAHVLCVKADSQSAKSLREAGFELREAGTAEEAIDSAQQYLTDAIVVDLAGEGKRICRQLRTIIESPILALTDITPEGDVDDGSEDGADDYVTKPCPGPVLAARLRALLRRMPRRSESGAILQVRDLAIDQERLQVQKAGRPIGLTPTQFRLLHCLARNAGRVMTSLELLREAQGYECDDQEAQEIVKVHISHLRQKIEPDPTSPGYIVNVRGFGYMLERRARTD